MKILITFVISLVVMLNTSSVVLAQTNTPKPANQSITDTLSEQITDLKEKIASRVAELDLVEKKGVIGVTTEVEDTKITLTDIYGKSRIIDVDEITNFSSPDDDDSFGISDIKPGMKISVLGLYNKETERILARYITVVSLPQYIVGQIDTIDEEDFSIIVTAHDNASYTIDIETSTTTQEYSDTDFERAGFSDLEIGQSIFITGFEDTKDPSIISASRILIFSTSTPTPTPKEEAKE